MIFRSEINASHYSDLPVVSVFVLGKMQPVDDHLMNIILI